LGLSHYLQGFKNIPAGERRISEPSTGIINMIPTKKENTIYIESPSLEETFQKFSSDLFVHQKMIRGKPCYTFFKKTENINMQHLLFEIHCLSLSPLGRAST